MRRFLNHAFVLSLFVLSVLGTGFWYSANFPTESKPLQRRIITQKATVIYLAWEHVQVVSTRRGRTYNLRNLGEKGTPIPLPVLTAYEKALDSYVTYEVAFEDENSQIHWMTIQESQWNSLEDGDSITFNRKRILSATD